MTREEMMDNIIKQYGFESNITITFCGLAEKSNLSDSMLRKVYDELMGQNILAHSKAKEIIAMYEVVRYRGKESIYSWQVEQKGFCN